MLRIWSPLVILCVCLCLQHAKTVLECPSHTIRLINRDDVESVMVDHHSDTDFDNLISTSMLLGDYFVGLVNSLPNTGSLVFHEQLLLVGFTTAGIKFNSGERFVSNFTFQYSATDTESYNYVYKQGFIQQSSDEEAHVFNKTFIAKRLQFTIHEAESPFEDYYWRINLFVCLKSEGVDTGPSITTVTQTSTTTDTSTATVAVTTTVFLSTTCTVSSAQLDASQTASQQQSSAVYSCYGEIGTMALFLLLFIVTIIVLIIIVIVCYKRKSQTSVSKRSRTNTLNELTNVYYTTSDPSVQRNRAYTLTELNNTALYSSESSNDDTGARHSRVQLVDSTIPTSDHYSDVDNYACIDNTHTTTNTSTTNTNTSVYEAIESTGISSNPLYTSIDGNT